MKSFNIKPRIVAKKLVDFIAYTTESKGFKKVILGLSGGLDSTVVAYLSQAALGKDNITGVLMPYGKLSQQALQHARKIVKNLCIKSKCIDITEMVDAYFKKTKISDRTRCGNKMARERMSILYDLSEEYNSLVIGTSNRTELLLGYGTIHGDCACALNPIGSLYKTQLRSLAKYIGVPSFILDKPPSANLWQGQTDEEELGYQYEDIDKLLFFMIDNNLSEEELVKRGFAGNFVHDMRERIRNNSFKSELPAVAQL